MQFVVPRESGVASLRRRATAGAIDAGIAFAGLAGVIAVVISFIALLKRPDRVGSDESSDPSDQWKRWEAPIRGAAGGLALTGRNWRTPGMRIVGLRRVDARTRGPVGTASPIVATAFGAVTEQLTGALNRPILERYQARQEAVAQEVEKIRAARPDADAEELMQASLDVQRHQGVGCGWLVMRMVGQAVALRLPALRSRRRQTLAERVARTIVVDDR